jgi:hypothetical protein
MSVEISRVIYAILALLSIMVIYVAVLFTIFYAFSTIFRLLYKTVWFRRLLFRLQTRFQQTINYISPIAKRLLSIVEILIDPIFYGYAIVAVYERVQNINQYTQVNPQYKFWNLLEANMNYDEGFWIAFYIIFTIWFLVRTNTYVNDKVFQKKVGKSMDKLLGNHNKASIGKINKEIREHLKKIKEDKK